MPMYVPTGQMFKEAKTNKH